MGKKDKEKKSTEEKGEHQDVSEDKTFTPTFTYGKGKVVQRTMVGTSRGL